MIPAAGRVVARRLATIAALLYCMFVGACASLAPPVALDGKLVDPGMLRDYAFTGRIAVRQGESGQSGNLNWSSSGANTRILLASPLGQALAELREDSSGFHLKMSDGRTWNARAADDLTQQALGYRLPVAGLRYWVFARADPAGRDNTVLGSDGRPERIEQNGWKISYTEYQAAAGSTVPRRMQLMRGDLEIRLVLDSWTLDGRN